MSFENEYLSEVKQQKLNWKPTNLRDLGFDDGIKFYLFLTLRRLMSYIYGAPILDVSRSHTTTQHSR